MRFIDRIASASGRAGCGVLEFSDKTYYARKRRPPSAREVADERLLVQIRRVHEQSGGACGSRRMWKQLKREGIQTGRCRVERLMSRNGLRGAQHPRKRFLRSPTSTPSARRTPSTARSSPHAPTGCGCAT